MTKQQWKEELDFGSNSPFLHNESIDHLWDISKGRNMKSVEWIRENIEQYEDEKDLWWRFRFRDFDIWREERMVIVVPGRWCILINKNQ